MDVNLGKLWEMVRDSEAWLQSMGSKRVGHDLATEKQQRPTLFFFLGYQQDGWSWGSNIGS